MTATQDGSEWKIVLTHFGLHFGLVLLLLAAEGFLWLCQPLPVT
jgi:hypothetical protein